MRSESEHHGGPPLLSWEPVIRTGSPENALGAAAPETAVASPPDSAPQGLVDSVPLSLPMASVDFDIAPITLDSLKADLKTVNSQTAPDPLTPKASEFQFDLNDIEFSAGASTTVAPQSSEPETPPAPAVEPSMLDSFELKIAPLDMPDLSPSGRTPSIEPMSASATPAPASPAPLPAPPPAPPAPAAQVVETPAAAPPMAPEPDLEPVIAPTPSIPGLPTDPVSLDPAPTTVIPGAFEPQTPVPALPAHQPVLAKAPQTAAPASRATYVAEPDESGKKQKQKLKKKKKKKKQQQKQQKQKQQQKSGGGGVALFFTLLVLAGLVAGVAVYGRPYLFPEEGDQLNGEATEPGLGADMAEPLVIDRQVSAVYGLSMADHLLGDWAADLPTWRSLALAEGPIDTPGLHELVANWAPAYYSPGTSSIVVNSELLPGAVESSVAEAMALAVVDQQTGWVSQLDPAALDASALIEARAVAESRRVGGTTNFGVAIHPDRRIDIAAFLPPVLEYRINAPLAFAEFAGSGDIDIAGTGLLALSREPELASTDTITTTQQQRDRTFWYMVFAAYNSPAEAYAATNALVQTSLATVDRAGVQCTYITFSGTNVAGTAQLTNVLQTWASTAPPEMAATTSVLSDGAQQLALCDPGAGFESGARFGVAREIARLRTVELAALENVDPQTGSADDRAFILEQVRATQAGLPMLEQLFDTPYVDSARVARSLVSTPNGSLGIPSAEPAGGALGE
jgi:hypothetical protein